MKYPLYWSIERGIGTALALTIFDVILKLNGMADYFANSIRMILNSSIQALYRQRFCAYVGAALTHRIHLNAEYYSNSPNQMQNSGGTVNWTNTYSNWQETGYIFSVAYEILGSEIHSK